MQSVRRSRGGCVGAVGGSAGDANNVGWEVRETQEWILDDGCGCEGWIVGILDTPDRRRRALHAEWFYQTGQQWFDTCWAKTNSDGRTPSTPEEAISSSQCEESSKRALFNAGYTFSGNPEYAVTPELKMIIAACTSNYSDVPIGGIDFVAVSLVQSAGGPQLADRFMPPDKMILRAFNSKWPNCIEA